MYASYFLYSIQLSLEAYCVVEGEPLGLTTYNSKGLNERFLKVMTRLCRIGVF